MGWEHESPIQREVPTYTVQGTLDGTTAQVFVPETGNAEQLDLNWWLKEKNRQIVQDESGAMVWPAAPSQADGDLCCDPGGTGDSDGTVCVGYSPIQMGWGG